MAHTTIATLPAVWDCRWSRLGYRIYGVEDHLQPESLWVCVRAAERRGVTEVQCAECPYWQESPARAEQ